MYIGLVDENFICSYTHIYIYIIYYKILFNFMSKILLYTRITIIIIYLFIGTTKVVGRRREKWTEEMRKGGK